MWGAGGSAAPSDFRDGLTHSPPPPPPPLWPPPPGFKDEDLKSLTEELSKHIIDEPPRYYTFPENSRPDVWFSPQMVWEVMAADLSLSPAYKAAVGLVDPTKGISLRFPRYLRTRTDKEPDQATSAEQVAEMYNNQAVILNQTKGGGGGGGGGMFDDDD